MWYDIGMVADLLLFVPNVGYVLLYHVHFSFHLCLPVVVHRLYSILVSVIPDFGGTVVNDVHQDITFCLHVSQDDGRLIA